MNLEPCVIDSHVHVGLDYANYLENSHPYAMSFEDLAERMERHGVGRAVVFPFGSSYHLPAGEAPAALRSRYPYEKVLTTETPLLLFIYPAIGYFIY